jgi:PKD repeat protein
MGFGLTRLSIVVLSLISTSVITAQNTITPNTTLAIETANNTSSAAGFAGTSNGNTAAGNVSKLDTRNLLYPGATTQIFAHLMGWFGSTSHYNVGYNSADPVQVNRQVTDMLSRGISGAILDWYGPNHTLEDNTAKALKAEAESRGGAFTFAIMEDGGALSSCGATAGCDVTQRFINDLNYAYSNYVVSPNYLRIQGRPIYFTFGTENFAIDWTRVTAGVQGTPAFIFENAGGFSLPMSIGAYGWPQPLLVTTQDPMALNYLTDFFWNANHFPNEFTFGVTYKGFDDTLASWSANRHIQQNCGQTWLGTFARTNQNFSASKQIPFLQLVSWNDYEEGTALEMGIDNCVLISGAVDANGNLGWSIGGGQENTIDHYSIFISQDGQNLMKLSDVAAGQHNLNVDSYNFGSGTYSLFIKAWGQPSITNKMSAAIPYTVVRAVPPTPALIVTPNSGIAPANVTASTSGSVANTGTITSTVINWGDGSTSNAVSASHTYNAAGSYTVTATVTNGAGLNASATASVTVKPNIPPTAALTLSQTSGVAPVTLTASTTNSTAPNGNIVSSTINWGDGTSSAGTTASHTYSRPGTYVVSASVTDNVGSSGTTTQSVQVLAPASVVISAPGNNSSVGLSPTIAASGTTSFAVMTMQLTLDGALIAQSNSAVISTTPKLAPGAHTVVARLTDSTGATASQSIVVNAVNSPPTAALSVSVPNPTSAPMTVNATTASSFDSDGNIGSSVTDWGDGSQTSAVSAQHAYVRSGTYTVTATVTDNYGATAMAKQSVTLQPATTRSITVLSPMPNSSVGTAVHMSGIGYSPAQVVAVQVYVDNLLKYQSNSASIDTTLNLTVGSHYVVFQGWDSTGQTWKSGLTIKVGY